jgi:thiamine biosynthesis protein ThiS
MAMERETSIAQLLLQLDVKATRVAVELNLDIVSKSHYDTVILKDGDRVEVVGFVGGG